VAQPVRFVDGPLDGDVFVMARLPPVLYARRSVDTQGVVYVPDSREPPAVLHAGSYRKAISRDGSGELLYRFEE
jgi:hypothetical protein